ncbi:hypothetical protein J2Z40_000941 [Cytobacillus eiseniae]|uniref:Uncharacterized protein n=1 Tax=Cytobacillus eiseniae TaxID=762947 RepID=A0ABS4RDA7_9BACI|nr:hypothetical protein [Cytobacillus eiseniae]MBP2240386.1 hypothetical protein [Cytobacillus eiseniae]
MNMTDRYIELVYSVQADLKRNLTLEEIQHIKGIVAREFQNEQYVAHRKPQEIKKAQTFM